MTATDKVFAGSIPELYERYFVPLIFEPYALDLAGRIADAAPHDVLETAAGTGIVTRAMAARLPKDVRIVATDLNQPMLDQAAARLGADHRVTWRQADAQKLPFEDRSFDVVACQFGVMFFPDKAQGFSEARRVLKPNGRFLFSVWDRIETNEFADVVTEALAEMFPQDPPRFMARTPHGHYDTGQLQEQLKAVGFSNITVDAVEHRSRAPSPREPAIAYCEGSPLRSEIEARGPGRLEEATNRCADAIAKRFGTGAVDGLIRAYVISASG
jgi:ubiquinone/menaquinone biosynthesis C-methylase UbiE